MQIYEEQQMRIRWNNSVSVYFTISNGVKQGGVLSPVLFSIYLDQLLVELRHLGMGCYMNGLFTGVFIYADDITLLAPSRASMVRMLEKCESFVLTHNILFNASKTKYEVRHHKMGQMSRFLNIEIHTYSYSRISHLQFQQINLTLCRSLVKSEQF